MPPAAGINMKKSASVSIKHFMVTTSIRGLPRILKSETRFLKFVWLTFTLLSFGALLYFILALCFAYLDYEVTVQFSRPRLMPGHFPAVTICYDMPSFTLSSDQSDGLQPIYFGKSLVRQTIELMLKKGDYVNETFLKIPDLQNFDSLRYYQETFLDKILQRSFYKEPRVSCFYETAGQSVPTSGRCQVKRYPTVTGQHLDSEFFQCHIIKVPPREALVGTSVLVDLTYVFPKALWTNRSLWFKGDFQSQLRGLGNTMKVYLHPPDEVPSMHDSGLYVLMDRMVLLMFERHIQILMNTNRKPCVGQSSYASWRCRRSLEIETIRKRCHCHDGRWLFTVPELLHKNSSQQRLLPLCRNLSEVQGGPRRVKQHVICLEKVRKKLRRQLNKLCPPACRTEHYAMQRVFNLDFEKDKADAITYRLRRTEQLKEFVELNSEKKSRNRREVDDPIPSVAEQTHDILLKRLQCELVNDKSTKCFETPNEIITSPFAELQEKVTKRLYLLITPSAHTDFVTKERLVITQERLLSQIGGMCSLFIGLTLTVLAELVEILYRTFIYTKANDAFCENDQPIELTRTIANQ